MGLRWWLTSLLFLTSLDFIMAQPQELKLISGESLSWSSLKGKVVMIVNTASKCGFAGQLSELEKLYQLYKEKNFLVIAVPTNDFGQQEPLADSEIAAFCSEKFGVSFPIHQKTSVDSSQLLKFLIQNSPALIKKIFWNFEKFLIDKSGRVRFHFRSATSPLSKTVIDSVEALINE
jgi:glutathione peroxidase